MMYLESSSCWTVPNCDSDLLAFLPLGYDPMVVSGLLPPGMPFESSVGLLPLRAAAPKSFLTSGKSVGMQAPMRTQLASMLCRMGSAGEGKGEKGAGMDFYLVQSTTLPRA
jgi:hypothetical protein